MDDDEIDAMLAELARDEAPLRPALRSAILDGLPQPQPQARTRRRHWRSVPLWGAPAAAALCGLWLGASQPAFVLGGLAGLGVETTVTEVALLDAALADLEDWP